VKFLLDHDVPEEVAHLLRYWGHHVTLTREALEIEATDEVVFNYARQHQLVMLTCNRNDFLALAEGGAGHAGLIILVRRRTRHIECARLLQLLIAAGEAGIAGNINFA
jgi:predicted nuclease of predicted toxin-antitoxin system